MEGGIDIRLVVTIAGILFSVAGASAVAKMQIKQLVERWTVVKTGWLR